MTSNSTPLNNTNKKLTFAVILMNVLVMSCIFSFYALHRNVDGDEGLFLEAARLVAHGKKLYLDFFYQQMPLFPYLLAGWMKIFGFTLFSARYFSAFLTVLTGTCLLVYVWRSTQNFILVNLCGLLFYASGMVLAWAPIVKTHPLNMLTLTASCIFLLAWRKRKKYLWIFCSALALGIGINGRLTLGPFLLLYMIFIFLNGGKERWKNCFLFLFISGLVSLPTFYLFFSDPALFWKYNFTYHTHVYPGVVNAIRRFYTAQNLFLQIQFFILFIAAQISVVISLKKAGSRFWSSDQGFITIVVAFFIAIHMASAEPYTQYFSAMIPLLILLTIPLFEILSHFSKPAFFLILISFLFFYVLKARPSMDFEIASMLSDRPEWSLNNIQKTVFRAKKILKPGDTCLTWWPGYAFMAGCHSAPGMENHMRNYAVQRISPDEVKEYKMLSDKDLLEDLKQAKYRVVIDQVYHIESPYYYDIQEALEQNYWDVGQGVKVRAPYWFKVLLHSN